ncbi:MAG: hypothetical protein IJG94_05055 [Clostridia bacterium]|nr:hypothetical protein [Clostridia bacterium]
MEEEKNEIGSPAAESPELPAADAAAGTVKKKKRTKFHEFTAENDMKYRAPLNYQHFQMLGWFCMVITTVVAVITIGGKIHPAVTQKYGKIADILSYVAALSLPFLLIANFSKILSNKEGYMKQLLRNGGAALAIFVVTILMGNRYFVGTIQQIVVQKDEVVPMLTKMFQGFKQEGFLAFNLFIDLFLCTLTMYFLNARPKRVFTGKKIIILRLFALLPIAYEIGCFVLKVQAARGKIMLPLWSFPLLTVKPPMTFAFFVYIALLVRIREYRYCRHGKTHEEYQAFMSTKRNSFHLSVHFSIGMIIFAAIDAILLLVLTILQASSVVPGTVEVTEEIADAALAEGLRVAVAVGLGGSISLAFVAPLMLLYSYNSEPKNKMISMLIPVVGIVLMVIVVLEAGRKGVGMFMAGRQIDLDAIRDALKQLVAQ